MNRLTAIDVQRILRTYRYTAAIEYGERVCAYIDLLLRWNRKVALTTITDPQEAVRFHFGESLFGMETAGMQNGRLADVGSGAGFPGAPIAMARPELNTMLIESNGKKAAFLEELKRELRLGNVEVHHGRAEDVACQGEFDFVAARALGAYEKWLEWAAKRLKVGGHVVLWVNSEGHECVARLSGWKWAQRERIPNTKGRFIAIGERSGLNVEF